MAVTPDRMTIDGVAREEARKWGYEVRLLRKGKVVGGGTIIAPNGAHVMSIHVQFAPYNLKDGDWDSRRDELGDTVINTPELQSEAPAYQHPRTESLQLPYVLMPRVVTRSESRSSLFGTGWQRVVIFVSFALMCMLIGFDLMGLLVLHMH